MMSYKEMEAKLMAGKRLVYFSFEDKLFQVALFLLAIFTDYLSYPMDNRFILYIPLSVLYLCLIVLMYSLIFIFDYHHEKKHNVDITFQCWKNKLFSEPVLSDFSEDYLNIKLDLLRKKFNFDYTRIRKEILKH